MAIVSCVACGRSPTDVDHIKTRGSGGSDENENTWNLCRLCHIKKHQYGLIRFVKENPHLAAVLRKKGWKFDDYRKKWARY